MVETTLTWRGGQRFEARLDEDRTLVVDGEAAAGPSPVEGLLASLAACMAIDVVDILAKGRQEVRGCSVRAEARRREDPPRRLTGVRLVFDLEGPDLSRAKAERAVDLSRTTYCSVLHTLDPALSLETEIRLTGSGESG